MGNSMKRVSDGLSDPRLVRSIQEWFGVKEIVAEEDAVGGGTVPRDETVRDEVGFRWLTSKAKTRKRLRHPGSLSGALPSPPSSPEFENTLQRPEIVVETIPVLDIFFRLATELGYESFYITFIPFLVWNVDTTISRHIVTIWILSMYLGQASKALFRRNRPSSPPALRLENNPNLETEYGFPSTHAIVSTTVPFYIAYGAFNRYELPLWAGLPAASFWCGSVCLSRLYLGVHTPLDLLGGLSIAVFMMAICVTGIDLLDWMVFDFNYTLIVLPLLVIFMLYVYPVDPNKWTMDRGDTAAILGSGMGVIIGFHIYGRFPDDIDSGPFKVALPSLQVVGASLVRFVVGVLLLLPTRFVMKLLCFRLLPAVMPTHGVEEVVKRPLVELPYKIITYSMIGFNAVYLATYVFEICGIMR